MKRHTLLFGLLALQWAFSALANAACNARYELPITSLGYVAYRNSEEKLAGYGVDLTRELARRSGCEIELSEYPPARIAMLARKRQIPIMVFSSYEGPSAPPEYWTPTLPQTLRVLIRRDRAHTAASFEDLLQDPTIVFGWVRGMHYGSEVGDRLAALPAVRQDISASNDDLFRKLAAGRIDAAPGLPIVYLKWVRDLKLDKEFVSLPVKQGGTLSTGWTFFSPPLHPKDLQRITGAAESIRDDGTELRLLNRYVGKDETRADKTSSTGAK